jgi:hypothetical protein
MCCFWGAMSFRLLFGSGSNCFGYFFAPAPIDSRYLHLCEGVRSYDRRVPKSQCCFGIADFASRSGGRRRFNEQTGWTSPRRRGSGHCLPCERCKVRRCCSGNSSHMGHHDCLWRPCSAAWMGLEHRLGSRQCRQSSHSSGQMNAPTRRDQVQIMTPPNIGTDFQYL